MEIHRYKRFGSGDAMRLSRANSRIEYSLAWDVGIIINVIMLNRRRFDKKVGCWDYMIVVLFSNNSNAWIHTESDQETLGLYNSRIV